jgi:hypoxanthine-DNA glycosylase
MRVQHTIPPLYNRHSRILILGSFPSVKSRETGFFYGHPQNRYWRVLARLWGEPTPQTVEQKRDFLLRHHIAAWDVIADCEIVGSSDASIRDAVPNDLSPIFAAADIRAVFVNGGTAARLYQKHMKDCPVAQVLPSTSPANAAWSLERLCQAWQIVKEKAEE